jgi:hypothetical protein
MVLVPLPEHSSVVCLVNEREMYVSCPPSIVVEIVPGIYRHPLVLIDDHWGAI